jgi:aryl-alcohol dehydrogenase-like predicted oxidoreductase
MSASITSRANGVPRRSLGRTGLEITRIGCGGWQLGGGEQPQERRADDDEFRRATIHRALEAGINWIDTAPVYGFGHSELRVARTLRELSQRPLVFTKCGVVWDDRDRTTNSLRRESIRRECEESLRRLETDVIDLYQIHWPIPDEEIEEGWAALAELKQEGKVAHIGVSNFSVEQLRRCESIAPVETLQPPYSLVQPQAAEDVLPYSGENGIGVIVYSPQGAGLLTGKMTRERVETLPESDYRKQEPSFNEPALTRNLEIADRLRATGLSGGSLAIAWTLANPAVTAAIVGFRRPEHVGALLADLDLERLHAVLREISLLPPRPAPTEAR